MASGQSMGLLVLAGVCYPCNALKLFLPPGTGKVVMGSDADRPRKPRRIVTSRFLFLTWPGEETIDYTKGIPGYISWLVRQVLLGRQEFCIMSSEPGATASAVGSSQSHSGSSNRAM